MIGHCLEDQYIVLRILWENQVISWLVLFDLLNILDVDLLGRIHMLKTSYNKGNFVPVRFVALIHLDFWG
jgi:hypothetical protein